MYRERVAMYLRANTRPVNSRFVLLLAGLASAIVGVGLFWFRPYDAYDMRTIFFGDGGSEVING